MNLLFSVVFISLSSAGQSSADVIKTVDVGSKVSFECETNSTEPLRWKFLGNAGGLSSQWIHTGEEFAEDWWSHDRSNVSFNSITGTGVLSIMNVQESDSGQYSCLLLAKRQPWKMFELYVLTDNVTLNCTDERWIQWRCLTCGHKTEKGDGEIINSHSFMNPLFSPRFSVTFNATTGYGKLLIENVEESDTGNYSCVDQNGISLSTFYLHARYNAGTTVNLFRSFSFTESGTLSVTATSPQALFEVSEQDEREGNTTDVVIIVIAVVLGVCLLGLMGAVSTCVICFLMKRISTPAPQTVNQVFVIKENHSTIGTRFPGDNIVSDQTGLSGRELTADELHQLTYCTINECEVEEATTVDSVASAARVERPATDEMHHTASYEKLEEAFVGRRSLLPPPLPIYKSLIIPAAVDE